MFTFNGTGTTLYGRREVEPDGSYIATKWLVLLFIPLLPLASYRVWRGESSFRILGTNTQYQMRKVPLHWKQVLITYALTLGIGPFLLLTFGTTLLGLAWGLVAR